MNADEKVRELREFIDKNGLRDAEDVFDDVVTGHDPALIRPLLLMRQYSSIKPAYKDEMWTVLHAVEGFPVEVYTRELVATAGELCRVSRYFFDLLVSRIMNVDKYAVPFISELDKLPGDAHQCLVDILVAFRAEPERKPSAIKNCDAALAKLGG